MSNDYHITALLGGTFDPVHCGHLAIAEYLSTQWSLTDIQFIPCLLPPHRQPPQASAKQRLDMLKLAIAKHSGWIVNEIDYQRPPPSYMIDTLHLLRQQQPKISWCLILGMDAFAQFNHWRAWSDILNLVHLIVINRPGYELPAANWSQELLARAQIDSVNYFRSHLYGGILLANMPPSPVSATDIRKSYYANAGRKLYLPTSVAKYIEGHQLYKST